LAFLRVVRENANRSEPCGGRRQSLHDDESISLEALDEALRCDPP